MDRQFIPPCPDGMSFLTYRRMVEYIYNDIRLHVDMFLTAEGRKILEREQRITDECFSTLKKQHDLSQFNNLLEIVGVEPCQK